MGTKSNVPEYKKVSPPFGYYGSKHRIASAIVSLLPQHNAWVEAFCGSCAVTLAKPPAPMEIINDMDDQVINLFKQLRENQDELCRLIALTPYALSEYLVAREHQKCSPLEKARQFLVATMMAVNGANGGNGSGFSFSQSYSRGGKEARVSRWYNLPERIAPVVERLRSVRIENRDARELLEMFEKRPATLIYLDPPYNIDRTQRYSVDVDDKYHTELLTKCLTSKAMILISGYENDLYNSILTREKGWEKRTISALTKDTSGKEHERTEILWSNKNFNKALNNKRIPIRLAKKEKQYNKVNPAR
jgi:DNA adenine methylase